MLLLAQAQSQSQSPLQNLFDTVTAIFSRGDALAHPETVVEHLSALSVVWATVFVIVGVLCLLNGYKAYRIATVGVALVLGMFAGYWLGLKIGAPYIVAGCCGLLLAVAAWPLMKYAIAVFGGLAGAFAGANLWSGIAHALAKSGDTSMPPDAYWIGALVGLLVCGMLAFILFKLSIEMFTSVSGATVAVMGVLALLLAFEPWRESIASGLTANQLVIPMLVFVPAVIGLIFQEHWGKGGAKADT